MVLNDFIVIYNIWPPSSCFFHWENSGCDRSNLSNNLHFSGMEIVRYICTMCRSFTEIYIRPSFALIYEYIVHFLPNILTTLCVNTNRVLPFLSSATRPSCLYLYISIAWLNSQVIVSIVFSFQYWRPILGGKLQSLCMY